MRKEGSQYLQIEVYQVSLRAEGKKRVGEERGTNVMNEVRPSTCRPRSLRALPR